jgi:hypothetical protein
MPRKILNYHPKGRRYRGQTRMAEMDGLIRLTERSEQTKSLNLTDDDDDDNDEDFISIKL